MSIRTWILLLLTVAPAFAHQTSDSFLSLTLTNRQLHGRWSIALRDLNHVLMFDSDADGEISDHELEAARPKIDDYAFNRIKFTLDQQIVGPIRTGFEVQEHDDAVYCALSFELPKTGEDLLIDFSLFFDTDPLHRGLFRLDLPERTDTAIFSPSQPVHRFFVPKPQLGQQFLNFLREGVWHIWIGYDHILFLIALLLPSVLRREDKSWQIVPSARLALLNTIKIVTAFTVAHSITLSLAALEILNLPSRIVESVIAASVFLAAINNLKPIFPDRVWMIAFGFGLIHGFGFANVLGELGLDRSSLAVPLLAFNLGVEAGQLAIVLVFVPIAFAFRATRFYQQATLRFGSILIAALSAIWLCERLFDKKLLPF